MTFHRLGHRRLAKGAFLRFDRRYLVDNERSVARDVIRHPGGVGVLPIDGERVWLVSQFRTAAGSALLEIPAGKVDLAGSDPLLEAKRELAEEIGATAASWIHLAATHPSPGYTDEVLHLYAATGLTHGNRQPDGAEEEQLTVVSYSLEEALDRIDSGEIVDAKTQIALLLWARRKREM